MPGRLSTPSIAGRDASAASPGDAPIASVIIPTKDAGVMFDRVLGALAAQRIGGTFEIVVIDSGSTDGTVERARASGAVVREIDPGEFQHSVTRNMGASLARGKFLVFLTQDAVPEGSTWLESLVSAVEGDARV